MGNVGKKIKVLAWVLFGFGIAYTLYLGITTMVNLLDAGVLSETDAIVSGLIIIVVGIISSGISLLLLYGFGELIDKTCDTNKEIHLIKRVYFAKNDEFINSKKYKCPTCGKEIILGDKTCSKCGTGLEWE